MADNVATNESKKNIDLWPMVWKMKASFFHDAMSNRSRTGTHSNSTFAGTCREHAVYQNAQLTFRTIRPCICEGWHRLTKGPC